MRIATYNVNSLRKRLPHVLAWLERHQPDVLCLQETKTQDKDLPLLDFKATGYHAAFRGMKAYNGVAILSRTPPERVWYGFDDGGEPDEARLIRAEIKNIPILNTYIPQGFKVDSPKYAYKLQWFKRLRAYFEKHLSPTRPAIWCGDMNVAPESMDVHSPETHLTHVCFHEAVRLAYKETAAWGFRDVFRKLYPNRQQFTFWDYRRPSSVDANKGWRVDHVMATAPLAERCVAVEVDMKLRIGPQPSDHTLLWADFAESEKGRLTENLPQSPTSDKS